MSPREHRLEDTDLFAEEWSEFSVKVEVKDFFHKVDFPLDTNNMLCAKLNIGSSVVVQIRLNM